MGVKRTTSWGSTAAALGAHGWYAVALDMRGHGDSDWAADGDYSVDTLAADLRCVARVLGRPAVVGASLGGISALLAEGESPEPISRAVVLVDVAPRVELPGVQRIVSFMTGRPEGFASLEEAAEAVASYFASSRTRWYQWKSVRWALPGTGAKRLMLRPHG